MQNFVWAVERFADLSILWELKWIAVRPDLYIVFFFLGSLLGLGAFLLGFYSILLWWIQANDVGFLGYLLVNYPCNFGIVFIRWLASVRFCYQAGIYILGWLTNFLHNTAFLNELSVFSYQNTCFSDICNSDTHYMIEPLCVIPSGMYMLFTHVDDDCDEEP